MLLSYCTAKLTDICEMQANSNTNDVKYKILVQRRGCKSTWCIAGTRNTNFKDFL